MDVPEPWKSVSDIREESRLGQELRREIAPGHPLSGLSLRAILRRDDADDVLFSIDDGTGSVVEVHLMWSRGPEVPPWPTTRFFADAETWAKHAAGRSELTGSPAGPATVRGGP